ncbi:carboxymuconolactone decarboxylase [Maribellus comscasis]|uniref:Carboxymuconolactone decarboxylase n=1 Tax=Maribellus comscasis TaxID=2681766 RepID=A0A6I6JP08_9BACT|nr:carboxymuconolactone decarboxylase family protein [Maribellus comscasis]QGY42720.1 carboxymuconolactone decarboxylase [Maribellus comscasis]
MRKLMIGIISTISLYLSVNVKSNAMGKNGLNQKEKSLVSISSYTAQGNIEALKTALNEGLDAGLTLNEINEELVQLYAYCGFPKSLNGITAFMEVAKERKEKGITDEQGKKITMNDNVEDKYEQGRKVLVELTKMPQKKPAPGFGEFSPRIDAFLKEHLFADIFASDVLSFHQRELITIASLASTPGAESQLGAHIFMGMNVGVTENQLDDLFSIIEQTVGKTEAENGRKIVNGIKARRGN